MLTIERATIESVRNASSAEELWPYVQDAIELEHATIPTYLTAYFSIKAGQNQVAAEIIESIVVQEMLHMTIAANLLTAIGGRPRLATPGFIPTFPGPLPMNIGDGMNVGLRKLTRAHVLDTFMAIEEPEHALVFPVTQPHVARLLAPTSFSLQPEYATIGEFYAALGEAVAALGPAGFTGDPARQVVDNTWFPADQLFPIDGPASALAGIRVIVTQGEGTANSPDDDTAEPAHYYRFAQLVNGRLLVRDPSVEAGWSYSGAAVGIDPAGVWNLAPDAKVADYPEGSRARTLGDAFNTSYTNLLRALDATFDGHPDDLKAALGLMYELRLLAGSLVATRLPGTDLQAAPTFEYTPVDD